MGTKDDVDGLDPINIFGYEPNAVIRHCVLRHIGSSILAANDDGE